jgi:hypothetical protein
VQQVPDQQQQQPAAPHGLLQLPFSSQVEDGKPPAALLAGREVRERQNAAAAAAAGVPDTTRSELLIFCWLPGTLRAWYGQQSGESSPWLCMAAT